MTRSLLIQCAEGAAYREMLKVTHARHTEYARRFGFDFWWLLGSFDTLPSWDRFALPLVALRLGYDTVCWLDADALILDVTADLRQALPDAAGLAALWNQVPGGEPLHYNVGVLYFRRTLQTCALLAALFAQQPTAAPPRTPWWTDPLCEQVIFNRLVADPEWRTLLAPVDPAWHSIFGFHDLGAARVVHCAGQSVADKLDVLRLLVERGPQFKEAT